MAAVALLAVLLSWGNHFMGLTELFFRHFPMYNKFRTVSMILVIVEWCVPFLAAVVLQRIWCGRIEHARLMKGLKYSVLTVGGISLLFLLFGGALLSFSGGADSQMQLPDDVLAAMRDERASMMRADALRSLVFALLAAGAVYRSTCAIWDANVSCPKAPYGSGRRKPTCRYWPIRSANPDTAC